MILDTHDNLHHYTSIFRGVDPQPLFDWLKTSREVSLGDKVEFAGDKMFAKSLRFETGARDALKWETHREYIDLQYIVGGGEVIEWAPAAKLVADAPHDFSSDVQFYGSAEGDVLLPLSDGFFVFLFPRDAHRPLVSNGADQHVHKIIVKIHRSLVSL